MDGVAQPNERRLIKVVTLSTESTNKDGFGKPISTLNIHRDYLVTGFGNGHV